MAAIQRYFKQTPSRYVIATATSGYFAVSTGTEDAGNLVLAGSKTSVTAGDIWVDMGKVQLISGETYLKIGKLVATATPTIGYVPLNSGDGFHDLLTGIGWARV